MAELKDKVENALNEARILILGVQVLLGFQFQVVFQSAFASLPGGAQYAHLGGLRLIGISMVLLMTPAAYHRLVERGEESERFHGLASRLLLAAMAFFGLGIALDVWVVVEKVSQARWVGLLSGGAALAVFY